MFLALHVRKLQVASAHRQHIILMHSKRTSFLRHACTNCSWCTQIAKQDILKNDYRKNPQNKPKQIRSLIQNDRRQKRKQDKKEVDIEVCKERAKVDLQGC